MTQPDPPVQIDPEIVLTRVQQSSELGAALVRSAVNQVLAEHHAAEARDLRARLAELQGGDAPPLDGDSPEPDEAAKPGART